MPSGLKDGPLPAHYEPLESPVGNNFILQQTDPAAKKLDEPDNQYANSPDRVFPTCFPPIG